MNLEDSIFTGLTTQEVNRLLSEGASVEEIDIHAIGLRLASESERHAPQYTYGIDQAIARIKRLRKSHKKKTHRKIAKRLGGALEKYVDFLALAEVINRSQVTSIGERKNDSYNELFTPPFPEGLIGNAGAKSLTLNTLHARAVVIGQEIHDLLSSGFTEAAKARARSLYETTVVAEIVGQSSQVDNYDLSDRYFYSQAIERMKHRRNIASLQSTRDENLEVWVQRAREMWGAGFSDQYGWARPALNLSPKQKPAFIDLENLAGLSPYRYLYLEFNHSVHAGALSVLSGSDFRRNFPNSTRPESDPRTSAKTAWTAARLLEWVTVISTYNISIDMQEWDDSLLLGPANRLASSTVAMFEQIVQSFENAN